MAGTATISWISITSGLAIAVSDTDVSGTATTVPSVAGVPAGALMILSCACADDFSIATTVDITGTTLTWTKQVQSTDSANNASAVEIWAAPCPAGGTVSPSVAWQGGTGGPSSSVLYAITGQEASPAGTTGVGDAQNNASVTVATTRDNSLLICVTADWDATAGTHTYRDSATETLEHDLSPTQYRAYHYYKQATTQTNYTEGLTAPTSGNGMNTIILEIRVP